MIFQNLLCYLQLDNELKASIEPVLLMLNRFDYTVTVVPFNFSFITHMPAICISTRLLQILLYLLLSHCFTRSEGILPLGLPSRYPSTSVVVFLCLMFLPLFHKALLPVVYGSLHPCYMTPVDWLE